MKLSKEISNNIVIDFLVEDRFRLVRHLSFMVFFFVLLYFARFWRFYTASVQYYILIIVYISLLMMAYINMYLLVPKFFFRTYYILYVVLLITMGFLGLHVISYVMSFFAEYQIDEYNEKRGGVYEGLMMCISIILVTTTMKLLQKWMRDSIRIVELNSLTLNMELNELRNQINPHFLFNMLNNVKALIRTDPEKATTVIMKLSEFLRYQLYENNEEKTMLTSEIDFLSNFLNLEKIRRENFDVNIESPNDKRVLNSTFIPPNLFTTFVENAVKHSVDISGKESYVIVNIEIKDKNLHFECRNSQNSDFPIPESNYSGLGLANIKRRLELLYQNTFTLDINSTKNEYIVNLTLPV
ncbi:sensor histidine kinase [Chryseobacterium luquanense]|uniref:Histidine kinase n=1 Tax=Chryseobacterium luquanense TaxID=2983766 RepID=A0ABT3Y791_9FLAO|nr:histidine kinase [Chryseobacterium luquanense]MCX8534024.1 histidine kinase [Chryseobacterium luquanense]